MLIQGARPIEIVNLTKDDIFLDEDIPYIHINPSLGYSLKTEESKRRIPLVGLTLEAFKKCPEEFNNYHVKSDKLTSSINRWLSDNDLRSSSKHSLFHCAKAFKTV